MAYRTFLIGRSPNCELEIRHGHVSREHAELIIAETGEMLLVDRISDNQTFVQKGEAWAPIRQSIIDDRSRIGFGSFETSGADLRRAAIAEHPGDEKTLRMADAQDPTDDPAPSPIRRRDPATGQIIG